MARKVDKASVGTFEAKTHLSALLERVARGKTITITKNGIPVAKLAPLNSHSQRTRPSHREVVKEMRELRGQTRGGPFHISDMIDEGRGY